MRSSCSFFLLVGLLDAQAWATPTELSSHPKKPSSMEEKKRMADALLEMQKLRQEQEQEQEEDQEYTIQADGELSELRTRVRASPGGEGEEARRAAEAAQFSQNREEPMMQKALSEAEKLQHSFRKLDADEDGNIDTKDLHKIMDFWGKAILGAGSAANKAREEFFGIKGYTGVPDNIIQEFIDDMDADGDGKVEYSDYAAFATKLATSPQFRQMLKEKRDMSFVRELTTKIPELGRIIKEKRAEAMKKRQNMV